MNFRAGRSASVDLRTILLRPLLRGADAVLACGDGLFRVLPEEQALSMASPLGYALRWAQKQRVLAHMRQFLGSDGWFEARAEKLWQAHLTHLGHTIREVYYWNRLPREQVLERITVEGQEHVQEAARAGCGVMLFANHLGNFFSLAPAACSAGWDLCGARNPMPVRYLERRICHLVGRFAGREQLIGSGVPAMAARSFHNNGLVVSFVDFSARDKRNVWLPFGRSETRVSLGPALLAARHRVPVLCITCERMDAMHHRVVVHPPLSAAPSGHVKSDAVELTRKALSIVADGIRRHPEQWWPWDWAPLRSAVNGTD